MRTEKELGAIRVMEALSAVDEELLERSERTTAESGNNPAEMPKKKNLRRFARRYAMAGAACLCLAVLGAAYFSLSHLRMGGSGEDGNMYMKNGGADGGLGLMTTDAENTAPEMAGNTVEEAFEDFAASDGKSVRMEPEWLDVEQLAVLSYRAVAQESAEIENTGEGKWAEPAQAPSAPADVSEQDVCRIKEDFMAAADVPESYSPVENGNAEREDQDSLLYECEWSDGEHSLWLRITQTDLTADLRFESEPPVYTVEEEWRELLPDAGPDGYAQFGLLCGNGMLVEYCGALEREEIVGLLESVIR